MSKMSDLKIGEDFVFITQGGFKSPIWKVVNIENGKITIRRHRREERFSINGNEQVELICQKSGN